MTTIEEPARPEPVFPEERPSLTMVDVAYEAILSGIVTHRFLGGQVLQEAKLAATLNLSRTPVREALGRLEGEGLLQRDGRVLTVRSVTIKDYLEVLHLRRLLETEATTLATGNIEPEVLLALRARVAGLTDPKAITPADHWQLDDDIHLTIASGSGNGHLVQLIVDLRRMTRLFNLKKVPGRFFPGRDEHLELLDALLAADAPRAAAAMRTHIENVKKGILEALAL
ncbi:MAG: GntR family transcriptional regulator [Devosia sp.]